MTMIDNVRLCLSVRPRLGCLGNTNISHNIISHGTTRLGKRDQLDVLIIEVTHARSNTRMWNSDIPSKATQYISLGVGTAKPRNIVHELCAQCGDKISIHVQAD